MFENKQNILTKIYYVEWLLDILGHKYSLGMSFGLGNVIEESVQGATT